MGSVTQSAPSLPQPQLSKIASGITLLKPLSRRGHGPGLIVLVRKGQSAAPEETASIKDGFPSPALKWAEEGYAVVEVQSHAWDQKEGGEFLKLALDGLQQCDVCEPKNVVGLIAYSSDSWIRAMEADVGQHSKIVGGVIYDEAAHETAAVAGSPVPTVLHLAGKATTKLPRTEKVTVYDYPTSSSSSFAMPSSSDFHPASEAISHTRNLTFLKKRMNGPYFDLEEIWDEHTYFEFENRSTELTMSTMVQEPYVNHIPTMTGGIGRDRLSDFYQNHFIFNNPQDTELELISRTVGIDRVVDEFIYKFTHDSQIDWLLPGIPPTFKRAEIPFTAVVNVRGDRLYHEHIAWDQATVLRQLGLLPEYLPYPYPLPANDGDGQKHQQGNLEYRVPAAGIETANKMRDKNSVGSNGMFEYRIRERKG